MRKLLLALFILAALLLAADRGGAYAAQREISRQVAANYRIDPPPTVTIHGFPFLTQAANGDYRQVDIRMPAVTANGVRLNDVNVQLSHVRLPLAQALRTPTSVSADSATATALVPFDALARYAPPGAKLSSQRGEVVMRGTLRVAGTELPVTATLTLGVTGEGISVTPRQVTIENGPSIPISNRRLAFVVPVRDLPLHLKVTAVTPTPTGVQVTAQGRDIHFAPNG